MKSAFDAIGQGGRGGGAGAGRAVTAGPPGAPAAAGAPVPAAIAAAGPAGTAGGGTVHVVVTVSGFQPSPAGPVQAVVYVQCNGSKVEIGRFGILPQTPFSASEPSKAQRFSLTLSADTLCKRPESVVIRVVPTHGDGRGATLEIGGAELQ